MMATWNNRRRTPKNRVNRASKSNMAENIRRFRTKNKKQDSNKWSEKDKKTSQEA